MTQIIRSNGDLWSFFDNIRCINLVSRDDRYDDSQKVFNSLGIPVDFFRVKRHPTNGSQGAFESHIKVIKEAYDSGANNVLIFEDDITVVTHYKPEYVQQAIDFMSQDNNWDLVYLGSIPQIQKYKSTRTEYEGIYKTRAICAHAYVLSRQGMEKMKDLEWEGHTIDFYMMKFLHEAYSLYPSVFVQGLSDSDISDNWWERLANQNRVEHFFYSVESYAYYVNYPVTIWIPLIILIVSWYLFGFHKKHKPIVLFGLIILLIILILIVYRDECNVHKSQQSKEI